MTDIPEDVMKAATDVVATLGFDGSGVSNPDFVRDAIARAILAERERSAAWHNLNKTIETAGRASAAEEVAIDRVLAKYPNLGSTMRATTETK